MNAGAWNYIKEALRTLLPAGSSLKYVGRQASASPATGSHDMHMKQHAQIIKDLQQ
ncbi:MAG: sucA [Chlamydiia bacterium]|nr:sucA [Chlamydiia bacterium]